MKAPQKQQPLGRRSFLRTTAAVGSSLALSNRATTQPSANESLNIALIGAGMQGQTLVNVCMKIPGIHLQAVCDIWETYNLNKTSRILTGFKQEHTTYTDYQDMLAKEKDLQAVIIATPDFCHAEQTVACLKAGLNVYCESVMSNTVQGAQRMVKAAKESGKLLQIGHQRRSNPYYRYGYDHILHETRLTGKLAAVNGQWNRPIQPNRGYPRRFPLDDAILKKYGYASMQQFRNWNWYKQMGCGPMTELGSHQIDVFNWFLDGFPRSVIAGAGVDYYDPKTHENFDNVMAIYEYPGKKNTVRAFYQTINANSNFGYFENFMGDQGTLYLSENAVRVKVYREPGAPDWEKWVKIGILKSAQKPDDAQTKDEPAEGILDIQQSVAPPEYDLPVEFNHSVFKPHLDNFFNAVRGNGQLNCPADLAYATTVAVLKIKDAVETGQKITLNPADFQV